MIASQVEPMPRPTDLFDVMNDEERTSMMRELVTGILGPKQGDALWKQMAPALTEKRRQPGDALDPAENFWGGVWRIHQAE
jgi:hypothetical protein